MNQRQQGFLCVIISAIIFGCMPLAARVFYSGGGNSVTLVLWRNLLPLPVLYCLMRRSCCSMRITGKQLLQIILLSLGATATPLLMFESYLYISSGMATTIHFVYPVFVLLGLALFYKERITRIKLICVALCSAGILLFYTPEATGALSGMALAFFSGLTYAFYIIYLDKSGLNALPSFQLVFYLGLVSSVLAALYGAFTQTLVFAYPPKIWGVALIFSLMVSVGAVVLFQRGVKQIGSQHASILSTFEPLTSLLVGVLVFHEPLHIKTLLGVVLILSSVIILTRFDHQAEPV